MSRYTGPVFKKSRRYNFSILETNKEFVKGKGRKYIPGQHGPNSRIKLSDYGIHLHEKQKVKFMYGLSEKQLKNTFIKSKKSKGVIGTIFLQSLELRLDNVVYRMGFANTRRQSRQLVNHAHFLLNGKKVDIPSIKVKIGDEITLKPKSRNCKQILEALKEKRKIDWIEINYDKFMGTIIRFPERREINKDINESLVVEYYNK